jgi:hypothetical protein
LFRGRLGFGSDPGIALCFEDYGASIKISPARDLEKQGSINCLTEALAQLSMSRVGNCHDNAIMDSLLPVPKPEPRSLSGYRSPVEFEQKSGQ